MTKRRFKRPKNGHFRNYCGECAKWTPTDHEYCDGLGTCDYDVMPQGTVSLAWFIGSFAHDQYDGACPLFEGVSA